MRDPWLKLFIDQHACVATRRMYACDVRDLIGYLERQPRIGFFDLKEVHAVGWRGDLEARGLKPATISRKLAVARGLYTYLLEMDPPLDGLPARNPFRRIRAARFDRRAGMTPCPSPEEVRKLLQAIGTKTARRRRDLLIALLLFNQGLRSSEVSRLERASIRHHERRTYLSLAGKGGTEIRSVLGPDVADHLVRPVRSLPVNQRFVYTRQEKASGDRGSSFGGQDHSREAKRLR